MRLVSQKISTPERPATPKRRPRPWFSSPKAKKDVCLTLAEQSQMAKNIKATSEVLASLSNAADMLVDKINLADKAGQDLTPSRVPAVTSSTSNLCHGTPPLHRPATTCTPPSYPAAMHPGTPCQVSACHSIRRLPCGDMVDGLGHAVSLATDCEGRNRGGDKGNTKLGVDPEIEDAVDTVVRAIYKKRAEEENKCGSREQENAERKDINGARKRKLEEAELS